MMLPGTYVYSVWFIDSLSPAEFLYDWFYLHGQMENYPRAHFYYFIFLFFHIAHLSIENELHFSVVGVINAGLCSYFYCSLKKNRHRVTRVPVLIQSHFRGDCAPGALPCPHVLNWTSSASSKQAGSLVQEVINYEWRMCSCMLVLSGLKELMKEAGQD